MTSALGPDRIPVDIALKYQSTPPKILQHLPQGAQIDSQVLRARRKEKVLRMSLMPPRSLAMKHSLSLRSQRRMIEFVLCVLMRGELFDGLECLSGE